MVRLTREHIANCRLLLDRDALLRALPDQAVCAEIGVDQGGFTARILEAAQPKRLHLVDPWATKRYDTDKFEQVRHRFSTELATGRVELHRATSLEAASSFTDTYFDWVYLDTTHAYALTARELRAYAPKVKPGGMIAGHDYSMGNWVMGYRYGVIEAVHEFCVQEHWELVFLTAEPIEKQSFAIRRIQDASAPKVRPVTRDSTP